MDSAKSLSGVLGVIGKVSVTKLERNNAKRISKTASILGSIPVHMVSFESTQYLKLPGGPSISCKSGIIDVPWPAT